MSAKLTVNLYDWYAEYWILYNYEIKLIYSNTEEVIYELTDYIPNPADDDSKYLNLEVDKAGHYIIEIKPFKYIEDGSKFYYKNLYKKYPESVTPQELNSKETFSGIDLLHETYLKDYVKLMLNDIYEIQSLESTIYVLESSNVIQERELSFAEMIDNPNVYNEFKPSASKYVDKKIKLLWKAPNISQTKLQKMATLTIFYIEGSGANDFRIKVGDIIKDPVDSETFYIVNKVEEQYTIDNDFYIEQKDKIKRLYSLGLSRLNLNSVPESIRLKEGIKL